MKRLDNALNNAMNKGCEADCDPVLVVPYMTHIKVNVMVQKVWVGAKRGGGSICNKNFRTTFSASISKETRDTTSAANFENALTAIYWGPKHYQGVLCMQPLEESDSIAIAQQQLCLQKMEIFHDYW